MNILLTILTVLCILLIIHQFLLTPIGVVLIEKVMGVEHD